MLRLSAFLAVALLASVASAHLCVYGPPQRGAMHLDHPGDDTCAHFGPDECGGLAAGAVQATFVAGQKATIQFQQNLNHFASAPVEQGQPGFFSVQVAPTSTPTAGQWVDVAPMIDDVNVMDEVWVGNFSFVAVMPEFSCNPCTLRVQYSPSGSTNISDNFIQCVDIAIQPSDKPNMGAAAEQLFGKRHTTVPETKVQQKDATYDCCTPEQWEADFVTGSADGKVSYDAVNQRIYFVEPQANPGGGNPEGQQGFFFHHYINFTSQLEYVYDDNLQTCISHTTDAWEPFCYGSTESEVFEHQVTVAGVAVNIFVNSAANFFFGATAQGCMPVMRERQYVDSLTYFNVQQGIADPNVFFPPEVCTKVKHTTPRTHKQMHPKLLGGKKH